MDELLQQCTVKLSVPENGQVGTGFLIAPGYILTCGHVVRGAATATVGYKHNDDYGTATVEQVFAEKDIALLRFEPPEDLPCVQLSTDVPQVGEMMKKLLGADHPAVATSLNNLAVLYAYQKRYADAESHLIQVLDLQNRLLGQKHPDTKGSWNSYIQVVATAIQTNQAETLSDHPTTQDLIPKIRAALESQGE